MPFDSWPEAMTITEFQRGFRLSPEQVERFINSGHPAVVSIEDEKRILKSKLLRSNAAFRGGSGSRNEEGGGQSSAPAAPEVGAFHPIPEFTYQWPVGEERYHNAQEATATFRGKTFRVVVGFCERPLAGKPDRAKATVWLDGVPVSEFGGDNDFDANGLMAGVIKPEGDSLRHLRVSEPVPSGYARYRVAPYNEIVRGKHASSGMAVVCHRDDLKTMAEHALLRWGAKQEALVSN